MKTELTIRLLPKQNKDADEIMDAELDELETKAVYFQITLQDIPTIDEYELEELKKKQTHKEATRIEKLQIESFYFKTITNISPEQLYRNLEELRKQEIQVTPELLEFYDDEYGTKLTIKMSILKH